MHNNYFFIRQLAAELKNKLPGGRLVEAYSQNKDEAIFSFLNEGLAFHIIAHLTGQFTCLAFPEEYAKARKNTASIFTPLAGLKVTAVSAYDNERALAITFENSWLLVFKLFGRQANLLLFKEEDVVELFKKGYKADLTLTPDSFVRKIEQNKDALQAALPDYRAVYPTLDKRMVSYIDNKIEGLKPEQAAEIILEIIDKYRHPVGYCLHDGASPSLEICLDDQQERLVKSALQASTLFFFNYLRQANLSQLRQKLLQEVTRKISKTEVYLTKVRRKVKALEQDTNYRHMADLLMANLHMVPRNSTSVTLENFFDDGKAINIRLSKQLSPQENAERYYKKAKNIGVEITNLNKSIIAKEALLQELSVKKVEIEQADSIKVLRKYAKSAVVKPEKKETPFKTFMIAGYTVYVGNNARQNDLLTLKYARKDDLFFHAKDVSGSHVILKDKPGSTAPAHVLETVASIAAYYSKRKTDTLCPVGYTPKKYVRKPKGAAPGLVLVEREKVLLVPPKLPQTS